ncbi:MAG TPA: HEAT repeat domain-containing protein [Nannocystaceae bacterium]|nr:HEAT repeat domain-containing protein [Nannocystaceae bacterium]
MSRARRILPLVGVLLVASSSQRVHAAGPAAAAAEDDISILRARPTGMEEDEWRKKRREIAASLGDVRSRESTDALLEIVETERYDAVLSIAIEGLGKHGDLRAVGPLQKIYADRSLDTFVREDAAKALKALGAVPQDDARLSGRAETNAGSDDAVLGGPQLGTMGEASVTEEVADPTASDKPLPANLRAREREFGFVLGRLDLGVNTMSRQQPLVADGGVAAKARYVDERNRWGWSIKAELSSRIRNGDDTALAEMGEDTGNTLYVGQALAGVGEAHVYFGKTDVHAFAQLGLSERLAHVSVDDFGGGNQSGLSDTRFSLDIVPAGGLGYGRYLNAGSDMMVDAIVDALKAENILARDPSPEDRKAIRDAVYRRSNTFSAWPRTSAVLAVLQSRGLLARRASPRLVHRLRSVTEDPSYLDRPKGIRVRVGFLYDAPVLQKDRVGRGDGVGAPFLQFEAAFQPRLEHQILVDTRFWYDVIATRGFTTDTGATYTRFLHTKFHDYAGQWFAGIRGGVSGREYTNLPMGVDQPRVGYRATGRAGYAYGFRRGSQISLVGETGVDSGAYVLGLAVALQIGIARGSVWNPSSSTVAPRTSAAASAKVGGSK